MQFVAAKHDLEHRHRPVGHHILLGQRDGRGAVPASDSATSAVPPSPMFLSPTLPLAQHLPSSSKMSMVPEGISGNYQLINFGFSFHLLCDEQVVLAVSNAIHYYLYNLSFHIAPYF